MKLNNDQMIQLGEVLKNGRSNKKLTLEQVKIKLDFLGLKINKSDVQRLENAERKVPNAILLKNLCEIYNLDVIKMFNGIGYLNIPSNAKKISFKVEDERVAIPLYGSASAGPGYLNLSDIIDDEFIIPTADYAPGRFAVKIEGDSMMRIGAKSIFDGSVALVDPSLCEDPKDLNKKVCVFTYNEETFIKQLLIDNQNIIQLISFNPDVPAIIILQSENLICEGRVIKTYHEEKWCK